MYQFKHAISDLIFKIESDVELKSLQNKWFEKFAVENLKVDVCYRFCEIKSDDLVLPALNQDERKCILQCNIQTELGPGGFILPPIGLDRDFDYIQDLNIKSLLDVPLLSSPMVRNRINSCLEHPHEVTLILHAFSVTIFDYHLNQFDLFYSSEQQWIFKSIPLENSFRRMFSSFLPSFSSVMLHSSGVIHNNRAALFFAPDEGGKSTVLKNLFQGTVLSDDRNIIRSDSLPFTVYSTPWGQNNCEPQKAQLGGLFLIEKAEEFKLLPLKPSEMTMFLWNEHVYFWKLLPKSLRIKAFEAVTNICYQTPCYQMHFPKSFVDWKAIDEIIQDNSAYNREYI